MRRVFGFSVVLGLIVVLVGVAPAAAKSRTDVSMTVTTIFDPDPDAFTATGIAGCTSGLVYDGGGRLAFPPVHGVFVGYKVFDCGGDTGFTVLLSARFSYEGAGSVGTWSVVDAWGSLAGISGGGKLIGDAIDGGIIDNYVGTITG